MLYWQRNRNVKTLFLGIIAKASDPRAFISIFVKKVGYESISSILFTSSAISGLLICAFAPTVSPL